jgi:hypothetical protein
MESLLTTNVMPIVLVVASLVQTALLAALGLALRRLHEDTTRAVDERLTPALLRAERVLTNLEHVATTVRERSDDVSRAMHSVQHAATRVGAVLGPRAAVAASVAGGLLSAVQR